MNKVLSKNKGKFKLASKQLNRTSISQRLIPEGFWKHKLYSPIHVSDYSKFMDCFSDYCNLVTKKRLDNTGNVSDSFVKSLVEHFYQRDRSKLRDLESCLQGGGVKWAEEYQNLIVNAGLDDILDVYLSAGTQDTTWFVGLLAASPTPLAAWTATEIASNDFVNYDEASLQAFTDGGVSSQSIDNSASPATFTISTNSSSIGGAYLIGTNAKATPAGTLYAAGAFTGGNKAADDGDTLEVTCTFTSADDGV